MLSQALAALHVFFDRGFAKEIDSKINPQEVALYVVLTAVVGADACIPNNVDIENLARVLIKYGRDHPEYLNWPSMLFAGAAFQSAYSCNRVK
jgi:hypothetical protein